MSIYVYAPTLYAGTRELIDALQAKRLVRHDGLNFLYKGQPLSFNEADVILCWGHHVPPVAPALTLNSSIKYRTTLDFNTRFGDIHSQVNYYIPWQRISSRHYRAASEYLVKHNWKLDMRAVKLGGGYVPIPEYPDYGTAFDTAIVEDQKILVTNNNVLGPIVEGSGVAQAALKGFRLDFALVTISKRSDGYLMLRKINTAPDVRPIMSQFVQEINSIIENKRKG